MDRTLTSETVSKIGETILLKGWVDTRRDHGQIVFIDLRDRTGLVQIVARPELVEGLHSEDVIYVTGPVKARPEKLINPKLATGTVEVEAAKVELISKAAELPFDMGAEGLNLELPTLLDYRSLVLRHPKVQAIFRIQEVVIDSFRRALKAKDFLEFQAPSIISSAPEGGADIFEVKYFGHKAYLAQSPQLYKSLLVSAFERVFSVNKVFRAEPSVTTRHLTEVVSLDAEMGFIDSWLEVRDMAEYTIKFILDEVTKNCTKELELFAAVIPEVPQKIPTLKLREAQEIIYQRTGRDCRREKDPAPEDEREICLWAKETQHSDLVFISHYPTKYRPFYTYPDDEDPEYNQGFDLIGRGVEWMTGGRRIHDYQTLVEHAKKWGVNPDNIQLYLQAFKYGMPPLGGFAFGAERITMHILGLSNIREASLFPRDMERVDVRLSTLKKASGNDVSATVHGEEVFSRIKSKLDAAGVHYKSLDHDPVFTSADSARIRGTQIQQGAKALVMFADKSPILVVISASLKADTKLLKQFLQVKDLRMATAAEVNQLTGLETGCIPPFGSVLGLKTYQDKSLSQNDEIAFNAGLHTRSIIMKYEDFNNIEHPQVGEFSSEK
ncbi:aspartate--tRNA(Asn) ligase [Candidatus Amesbacteria bacterium RIFCSPHIGHO2_02_FULL_48_21]|uniref:Aspartate--tRNA ligase n=2 Tax=Candidatus Amesiibacteriota TaxID=1752730 RepID=A0A0G1RFH8_9BACT|nr:MAG: Aspartyl-tRNA synthetase [Candidatus Amesbacteria bacterium GW2011_GWA2_47_11]KKU99520.1 MAG: Aspartyl-tRNA synthetase [Candidatus Amesbacteria bacterium GW2011_GWA1_48_9]OGC90355.1 MAG: aspartate--tRNA(Asn) ligase [Candidatus Amesbacteria bacterium RBG_19FT_COMBO_48_16]OGC96411.1 MAG: aspartate--tRNA(Asn) ligase [Candidatus Amesbacteria bacterium RIFCSPHIGHO2_02_FULL_48_21]OGD02906.1 MAG: aspartate--tRNA(Asn) ligase [Candidatus Amesbacteria bacterium RIFOXYB1_FULL_47_12]OGD06546.1 MAG